MVSDIKPGGTFLLNCAWDTDELGKNLPGEMKRYIAKNNIKLYTVDGIGLARGIGLGGRVNMILQAAFFKLSNIIPLDDAVNYMKDAVVKTYGRKGEKIVAMNCAAVDAGIAGVREIFVPAEWADAADTHVKHEICCDRPELKAFVENMLIPINAQRGDSLPVSAFSNAEDGTFPQGSTAFEKRGVAVNVPKWIPENCIQCNQCSYVCPHAVVRPFVLNKNEKANAPAGYRTVKMNGKGCEQYEYAVNVSVLDCYGCDICANVCPAKNKALVMEPLTEQLAEQDNYDYAFQNVPDKNDLPFAADTVKGSQFKQPLLEFSGACTGCGETPYAKLITQLYGDRMYIANATGCSSIWGGSAPATPYTVNRDGKGPAWANSLFEDTAEYGYGMLLGIKQRREKLAEIISVFAGFAHDGSAPDWQKELVSASKEWITGQNSGDASKAAAAKLLPHIETAVIECGNCGCDRDALYRHVSDNRDMLIKKSVWAFGGDGWAYDIGFGGLDHVLASGDDINVMVFDTEVYSNTGGQASKASQIGQVAQFAHAGKSIQKKNLAAMAMTYGYVYVAQIAMGADRQQTIKAITEAESYPGPSLIIAYASCINHGMKCGMGKSQEWTREAVESGYWHNFRYDPRLKTEGKNPFRLDSKAPSKDYKDFIGNETRYTSLSLSFPERAEELFDKAGKAAKEKYELYENLSK
jgi:pyruvate-ferredoxin/flavodoxin oxidoreductase